MLTITRNVGTPVASQASLLIRNKYDNGSVARRGIVICHGYQQIADSYNPNDSYGFRYEYDLLVNAGYPVFVGDFGGSSTWGNDGSITNLNTCVTHFMAQPGVKTDQIILMATSMGNLTALNWMKNNLTKVAAYVGFLPALNLTSIHDNVGLALGTVIDAAYGGNSTYVAQRTSKDPILFASTFNSKPMRLWYSPDDAVTPPWMSTDFVTAVGGSAITAESIIGATGHSNIAFDFNKLLTFVKTYA